jgi:hypothetical protein
MTTQENQDERPVLKVFPVDKTEFAQNEAALMAMTSTFDWDNTTGEVSVWHKTDRHSKFAECLQETVLVKLVNWLPKDAGPLTDCIRDTISHIESENEARVTLTDGSKLCLDVGFLTPTSKDIGVIPSLVFLICNTEILEAVTNKTKKLLTECDGHVRAVVVFDIQYDDNIPQDCSFTV